MVRSNLTPDHFPSVMSDVIELARSMDLPVYLVGGSVRDALLGHCPKDLDVLVFGRVSSFAAMLAGRLGGKSIYLGQEGKAVWRIVGADFELDLVPPRGPDLTSDLRDRDFTVNALAWSPKDRQVVDLSGGLADLDCKLIRMVRRGSFRNDPIRLLRAFRLAAALDFAIEGETLDQIQTDRELIRNSAPERIRTELLGLLERPKAAKQIRAMHDSGILENLLPPGISFLASLPGPHQDEYSFEHTIAAIECLENFTSRIEAALPGNGAVVKDYLDKPSHKGLLKLSLVLRPLVPQIEPRSGSASSRSIIRKKLDAEIHFSIQKRFALSNSEAKVLADLLALRMDAQQLLRSYQSGEFTPERILRTLRIAGTNAVGVLLLTLAEFHASAALPDNSADPDAFLRLTNMLLEMYSTIFLRRIKEPPFIRGTDLMAEGVPPGPRYRKILNEIEAARIEGRLHDREEALKWLRRLLADHSTENN